MSVLKSAALAAVLAVPLSTAALAQSAPPMGPAARPQWAQAGDPVARHKAMCTDMYAERAGHLAKLEAKLNLTAQQRPAFDQWRQQVMEGATKLRDACLAAVPKANQPPTILDRETQMETMLTIRLQTLQSSRAALQTLYQSLTPEQKAVLDRVGHFGNHPHHRGWRREQR